MKKLFLGLGLSLALLAGTGLTTAGLFFVIDTGGEKGGLDFISGVGIITVSVLLHRKFVVKGEPERQRRSFRVAGMAAVLFGLLSLVIGLPNLKEGALAWFMASQGAVFLAVGVRVVFHKSSPPDNQAMKKYHVRHK